MWGSLPDQCPRVPCVKGFLKGGNILKFKGDFLSILEAGVEDYKQRAV